MADERRTLNEAESKEYAEYLIMSRERHIKFQAGIVPRFQTILLNEDVSLPLWGKTLRAGGYQMRLPEEGTHISDVGEEYSWLWNIVPDAESLHRIVEQAERENDRGEPIGWDDTAEAQDEPEPVRFKMNLVRVDVVEDRPLTFFELLAWLGIHDADNEGDTALADRIFYLSYGQHRDGGDTRRPRARKSDYARKDGRNVTSTSITMSTGPLTNALMARNDGSITAGEYFNETAVKVNTGSGGYVLLDVRASDNTDIDAAYREYRLNDRDRFWLDALYTIAIDQGKTTIEGSEILRNRGYANSYAQSAAATMADALKTINKATTTRVGIDVTQEKRNKRKGHARLVSSTRLQPVVNATYDLDTYEELDENGRKIVKDFTVNLQTADPIDALPLAKYERARGMLTTATANDFTFEGLSNYTTDDRQMWSYVLRVIKSKKLSGTILFETMWRNLELREPDVSPYAYLDRRGRALDAPMKDGGKPVDPKAAELATASQVERRRQDAVRKQRERMLAKLEKMLDAKQAKGKSGAAKEEAVFQSWEWHRDPDGRVIGVKIRRKKV